MKFRYAPIPTPKDWKTLECHPFSNIFAFDEGIDVRAIADHMAQYGFDDKEPIVIYQGKIISGRHRRKAAELAEIIDPPFVEFIGDDPLAIVKKDILRRHPSPSQLAMAGANLLVIQDQVKTQKSDIDKEIPFGHGPLDTFKDDDEGPPPIGGPVESKPVTRQQVAKTLGVSERSIDRATVVDKKGTFELKRMVRVGEISVSDAEAIATLPKGQQAKAIEKFKKGGAKTVKEAALPETKARKKSTVGQEKFSWKDVDAINSKVARIPDDVAAAYGKGDEKGKKGPYHKECIRHLQAYMETLKKWRDTLH